MAKLPDAKPSVVCSHIMSKEQDAATDARVDRDRIAKSVLVSLAIALALALLIAALHNLHYWTLALLWAGACFALGFLIGFLFGIPRTLQGKNSDVQEQRKTTNERNDDENALGSGVGQRVNTNLEEISDWLTKILVGLGLAEIKFVPTKLRAAAEYVSNSFGSTQEQGFALALIGYFSVAGFLTGYLVTRLYLQRAFFRADVWWRQFISTLRELGERADKASARTNRALHANSDINTALRDLDAATDAKGDAYTSLLEGHIRRLNGYRSDFPVSRPLFITLGRLYRKLGKFDDAIAVLDEFIKNKQAAKEKDDFLADAFYNRACYKSLKSAQVTDPAIANPLKDAALDDLTQALSIAPQLTGVAGSDGDFIPLHSTDRYNRLTTTQPNP